VDTTAVVQRVDRAILVGHGYSPDAPWIILAVRITEPTPGLYQLT